MKRNIFYIGFLCCMILGLMLEYYIGINGYVSRTQVHYAVEEAAMPFYLVESLCLFVLPIATLCAYCLESIVYKKKCDILHVLSFKQIFLKFAFCVYACIVIAKIIQISYFGEWIIMEQGNLYFYAPCPIKNAILLVISTACIGRHFFWLFDSLAVSYVILHNCYHFPSLSVRLNVQPVMKKHLYVLAFLAMLGFVSCTNTAPKSNSEVVSKNAPSISQDSILLNPEHIKSLIAADQAERNLWSYCIKESDYSPAFYEAIGDDGLDLYRVCTEGNSVYVVMMEDRQTYGIKDYIDGPTLSAGVEYEHDGHYEIIDDYTVDIIFDEWCRNYSSTNDSATLDPIYHMRCVHRYGLNNRIWNSIKKDTAILLDKRCDAFCGDKIWEYTH